MNVLSANQENKLKYGIDKISFYVPGYYLDVAKLAISRGAEPEKYVSSIGQEKMAILPNNEDIITMGANAAFDVVKDDREDIDLLIFATESAYDQSKASGIYVHQLLGLKPTCRVFEVKQACYGSTAALRSAIDHVKANNKSKALVIASDVSRYGLGSKGEFTQGCGAVAMLISANPSLMEIDDSTGFVVKDVMDFWSPNYIDGALVDGQYSTKMYLQTLIEAWDIYKVKAEADFKEFAKLCFHMPFSKISDKASVRLCKHENVEFNESLIKGCTEYNKIIGNAYTASLYISLISMFDNSDKDLQGQKIGLFAYGSGCMAEFFSGRVYSGYKAAAAKHKAMLNNRKEIDCAAYEKIYGFKYPTDGNKVELQNESNSRFVIAELNEHKRIYKVNEKSN